MNPTVARPEQVSGGVSDSGLKFRVKRFLIRRRIRISFAVIVFLIAEDMLHGQSPHNIADLSDLWSVVGLSFVIAGVLFRSWAAGVLNKDSELATNGPYALTRNPLYFGTFLLMIGFCTIIGDAHNFVALFFLALLLYPNKIEREEANLEHKFGCEWGNYVRSTPMLIPRRLYANNMFADWSFAQWSRNEEYNAVAGACFGLVVFGAWFYVFR